MSSAWVLGCYWPHRKSWEVFPPLLFFERICEELVLIIIYTLIEFTSGVTSGLLFGEVFKLPIQAFYLLLFYSDFLPSRQFR